MVFKAVKKGASKAGKGIKKGASAAGRGIKSAGRGVASVGEGAFSVGKEAVNRAVGLPEAGLNAVGILPTKKLRLRVIVLADASGQSVLRPTDTQSVDARVMDAVRVAREIFSRQARVSIVAAGGKLLTVDSEPAPAEALVVNCDAAALKDDLGKAGFFFRKRMARNAVGTVVGAGSPITAFVVEDVINKGGCSLGPLTDYVTVDVRGMTAGNKRTLAHELGHALGLPHTGGAGGAISGKSESNLMQPSSAGDKLNKRQVVVVRNSRHVTFL